MGMLLGRAVPGNAFQRAMIGAPVATMKQLLRDGIAPTAATAFADVTELRHLHATPPCTSSQLTIGPWQPNARHAHARALRQS